MNFEEARLVVLYVMAHELLLEELERAQDVKDKPCYMTYEDSVYAELIGERHWIIHLFDWTEDEMDLACRNHWSAFVESRDGNSIFSLLRNR